VGHPLIEGLQTSVSRNELDYELVPGHEVGIVTCTWFEKPLSIPLLSTSVVT